MEYTPYRTRLAWRGEYDLTEQQLADAKSDAFQSWLDACQREAEEILARDARALSRSVETWTEGNSIMARCEFRPRTTR